jgi:hypothetical protein
MADLMNVEWRNINGERDYPFSDGVTLAPVEGIQIPQDAFLDAVFYPINLEGELYLSSIDRMVNEMQVSDASGVRGTGELGTEVVTFFDDYGRPLGTLVLGPGFEELSATMLASVEATRFAAACVFPQNQVGVRAFLLPDGTLVTGDVTFAGEGGIRIDTYVENGNLVMRPMAVGVQSTDDCVDLPPPVQCLKVKQLSGSTLTVSQGGNVISLGSRLSISDICPPKAIPDKDGDLPLSHDDLCDEEPEQPEPDIPTPGYEGDCPSGGSVRYFIIPVTDLLTVNPTDVPAATGTPIEGLSSSGFQDILEKLPPRLAQAIEISVRGF